MLTRGFLLSLSVLAACTRGVPFQAENRYSVDAAYVDLRGTVQYDSASLIVQIDEGVAGLKHIGGRVDSVQVGLATGDFFSPTGAWHIIQQGESFRIHAGPDSETVLSPTTLRVPLPTAEVRDSWLVFVVHGIMYGPRGIEIPATNYAAVDTTVTRKLLRNVH